MKRLAGILKISDHWFDTDRGNNEKVFFLYFENENIEYHQEFREFWETCIQPIYVSRRNHGQNILLTDFKSNPRRCHPFADQVYHWYHKIYRSIQNHKQQIPFLILQSSHCQLPVDWRIGLSNTDYIRIVSHSVKNGNKILSRFQRRWKIYHKYKKLFSRCIQEIDNEVAFRFGKYKMLEAQKEFYLLCKSLFSIKGI